MLLILVLFLVNVDQNVNEQPEKRKLTAASRTFFSGFFHKSCYTVYYQTEGIRLRVRADL